MCNTPVEVQFTSAGCLNYPYRTPLEENRCISDILANAVDEYLAKRGQPSLSQFAD
jgi:hypothetical protein